MPPLYPLWLQLPPQLLPALAVITMHHLQVAQGCLPLLHRCLCPRYTRLELPHLLRQLRLLVLELRSLAVHLLLPVQSGSLD
mgnify:CR=1 FL=1